MSIEQKFFGSGILLLLTIAAGIWLSKTGKPYNTGIFNAHKLIALGAVVSSVIFMTSILKGIKADGVIIFFLIASAISILAIFITGALLSIGKLPYPLMRAVHAVSSFTMLASAVISAILLMKKIG